MALMTKPILNHTLPGEAVYDCFLGSGTTLIAAEQTGRVLARSPALRRSRNEVVEEHDAQRDGDADRARPAVDESTDARGEGGDEEAALDQIAGDVALVRRVGAGYCRFHGFPSSASSMAAL